MIRFDTPIEDHKADFGVFVKREDLSCPPPGPPFSKARGVWEHVKARPEETIGVLDTYHSQAGHAVARACSLLGKRCLNFYPEYKHEPGPREPQERARELGAELRPLKAGRSAILFHQAKKLTQAAGGYMMPNALKLTESVIETAAEVSSEERWDTVIVPISSGTIAAGVVLGLMMKHPSDYRLPRVVLHLGYSRSVDAVRKYVTSKLREFNYELGYDFLAFVDEGYAYRDQARPGVTPPWPCNPYYDLKALRWWNSLGEDRRGFGRTLFWNIG